ncbi:hypothetical protein Bca52824_031638 [Brassica carinata]|uniref:WD repeat-containing protein 75 second beta-propeller domain-containing protein n=1 Tax=Brassica carinata TaxID=52824 RepID=A0A8X7V5J7_BRACI|nr:hypothetical protein Bca52824_031638 [Brassica carinata]
MIRGGSSYVTSPPSFSNDAKKLLVCTGNTVSVFSAATGLKVTIFQPRHTAAVTTLIVVPASTAAEKILCYCWTASLDGTIRHWDFSGPELLKTIGCPCSHLLYDGGTKIYSYQSFRRDFWNLPQVQNPCIGCSFRRVKECSFQEADITSHKGHQCVSFPSHEEDDSCWRCNGKSVDSCWRGFGNRKLALGSQKKKVRSVVDLDNPGVRDGDDAESSTTWHWHSAEGTCRLQARHRKEEIFTKNRVSLVVFHVVTRSNSFFYNQIHLLKMPSMEILRTISGIKPPPSLPKMYEGLASTVAFDRSSGVAVLCAENYCVQSYDLLNDRGISEVQVCERNHQPGDEITVVVTAVALSLDGSVMSTTEVKLPEDGIGGLVYLKFWVSEPDNKTFTLSTIVYESHKEAGVSVIALHLTRSMAVSTSFGGDFKIWVCNSDKDSSWTCHACWVIQVIKPMTAAAFSGDGSVLAVAAENVITLWNPDKNILLSVLGATLTPITKLCFAGRSEFLVAASHFPIPELSVWNTSKLSFFIVVIWITHRTVTSAVDSSAFAVLTLIPGTFQKSKSKKNIFRGRDGAILLFNGSDPNPLSIYGLLMKPLTLGSKMQAEGGSISFLEGDYKSQLRLAYVNGSHERFGYTTLQLPDYDKKRMATTPFVSSERPWETIFSGSTLNFPSLQKLCG